METNAFSDVQLVVRSAGERTAETSHALLSAAIPKDQLTVIQERPFSNALRKTFAIAIDSGRKWTLTIDGDVLPNLEALERFVEFAERQPEDFCAFQGILLDKLFLSPRQVGIRIYRNKLIPRALEEFSDSIANSLRPESGIVSQMRRIGFDNSVYWDESLGLHDYEQYFCDIYRKAFLHARKSQKYVRLLIPHWKSQSCEDPDFTIALIGARAGLAFPYDLPIDVRLLPKAVTPLLDCLNLLEKPDLEYGAYSEAEVGGIVDEYTPLPRTGLLRRWLGVNRENSPSDRIRDLRDALCWQWVIPWLVGSKLRNLGGKLVAWSEDAESRRMARTLTKTECRAIEETRGPEYK